MFLGIQVGNWNQQREQRSKADTFSARLREDLRHEQWAETRRIVYYRQVRKNAEQALAALDGRKPLSDEQFAVSAYQATQYLYDDRNRSTYDELVSTGAMDLIADVRLRKIANDTFTTPLNDRIFERAQNSEYRKLFRETVSFEVQSALSARAGISLPRALDYSAIAHILDYPCTLDLPEAGIRDAVSALRAQPPGSRPATAACRPGHRDHRPEPYLARKVRAR